MDLKKSEAKMIASEGRRGEFAFGSIGAGETGDFVFHDLGENVHGIERIGKRSRFKMLIGGENEEGSSDAF